MKLWFGRKNIAIISIILIVASLATVFISSNGIFNFNNVVVSSDSGWTITVNGRMIDTDSLEQADVGVINDGDYVEISRTLSALDVPAPAIMFYSIHALVDATIDGKSIYSFGHNYYLLQRMVPKRYNIIPLGLDYEGRLLTIRLTGSCSSSFSGLSPVYFGERNSLLGLRYSSMLFQLLSYVFLLFLGIVLMILSPYMMLYHSNDLRLFFSGLISLLLGFYGLCYYGIVDFLVNNPYLNTVCEYTALLNIPTAVMGYLMSVFSDRQKKLFRTLFYFDLILFAAVITVCATRLRQLSDFTGMLHILAVCEIIFSVIVIAINAYGRYKTSESRTISSDGVFLIGMIVFMFLTLVDIWNYNFNRFFSAKKGFFFSITNFTVGALIFVSSLLISYLLYNIHNSNLDSMQSKIKSLAYTDPLTGLANRARCEQMMDMLTEEHGTYTIISLDLNKLKAVNDALGHHEGDRLISGFATILSDCFWDANLVGRMGGDEFIVFLLEERALSVTRRIHEFYSMISDWNRKEQNFQYSASYGYAYSYEVPSGSAHEVYMLADNRMYEMKKEHRNSREVMTNA